MQGFTVTFLGPQHNMFSIHALQRRLKEHKQDAVYQRMDLSLLRVSAGSTTLDVSGEYIFWV
jgi:hypothetical protein